jgi:pyrrolidone-carboxylate peptidase
MSGLPVDLPEPLWRTRTGHTVEVSDDAGGFYCEHCFYAARLAAPDAVVGFLHVPPDAGGDTSQAFRHRATREVLGLALRGLVGASSSSSLRVLLTGYRPWGRVRRNPSGDFVAHAGNLDAVVAAAGGVIVGVQGGLRLADVAGVRVSLARMVLPVDDRAIDGGPRSIQAAIVRHRPDVVVSLGVHRDVDRYRVERFATDRRLRRDGPLAHDEGVAEATHRLPPDERLARAIVSGSRSSTSTSARPSGPSAAPAS